MIMRYSNRKTKTRSSPKQLGPLAYILEYIKLSNSENIKIVSTSHKDKQSHWQKRITDVLGFSCTSLVTGMFLCCWHKQGIFHMCFPFCSPERKASMLLYLLLSRDDCQKTTYLVMAHLNSFNLQVLMISMAAYYELRQQVRTNCRTFPSLSDHLSFYKNRNRCILYLVVKP